MRSILLAPIAALLCACGAPLGAAPEPSLVGAYDADERFDLGALSDELAAPSAALSAPIADAIASEVLARASALSSPQIASLLERQAGASLRSGVASYLGGGEPAARWAEIGRAGELARARATRLGISSALVVSAPESGAPDEYVVARIVRGISVPEDSSCAGAACARIELTTDALLGADYPVDVLSAPSEAQLSGRRLELKGSSLRLNWGRLALLLLVDELLEPGQSTGGLREIALAAVNCRGLAGRLGPEAGWSVTVAGVEVGLSLSELIGACEQGVFGWTTRVIDRFHAPLGLTIDGSASVADTDRDNRIDAWTGDDLGARASVGEREMIPIKARLTAQRASERAIPEPSEEAR